MVLISVIMPIYNGEKYLEKSINMIINQTFVNFELILIDDGSKDNSKKICYEYSKMDSRIKVLEQNNQGAWSARNNGISESEGKYIMFLDCDDWYEINFLEEMYSTIEKYKTDLVICGQTDVLINDKDRIIKYDKVIPNEEFFENKDQLFRQYAFLRDFGIADVLWNKIYKSKIIKNHNIKFENFKRGEDAIFNLNYYEEISSCKIISKSLYKYRVEKHKPVWIKYSEDYYNVLLAENNAISKKLKSIGKYTEIEHEFQCRHFIYGVIYNFYGIILGKENYSFNKQVEKITELINRKEVINALNTISFNGKYNILFNLIKKKRVRLIIYFVKIKYIIKEILNMVLVIKNNKNIFDI